MSILIKTTLSTVDIVLSNYNNNHACFLYNVLSTKKNPNFNLWGQGRNKIDLKNKERHLLIEYIFLLVNLIIKVIVL